MYKDNYAKSFEGRGPGAKWVLKGSFGGGLGAVGGDSYAWCYLESPRGAGLETIQGGWWGYASQQERWTQDF